MHRQALIQRVDMLLGIVGFFTAVSFIIAVVDEVRGRPALRPALVLLGFALLLGLGIRARRRL